MSEKKTLGQRIEAHRIEKGFGVMEFAQLVGLSRNMIWKVETDRCNPSLSTLKRIADGLGVSVSVLLEESENE